MRRKIWCGSSNLFEELTAGESASDLQRTDTAVFVVEQNCPYQEVDDTDLVSIHFWKQVDNRLLAYARVDWKSQECASDVFWFRKANAPMATAKN